MIAKITTKAMMITPRISSAAGPVSDDHLLRRWRRGRSPGWLLGRLAHGFTLSLRCSVMPHTSGVGMAAAALPDRNPPPPAYARSAIAAHPNLELAP